jgi:hypothetical protein
MKRILEIARGSRARIHVPVGIINALLIAACFCFAVMASCDVWAAEPLKLLSAQTPTWHAAIRIDALPDATAPVLAHVANYAACPSLPITIVPHGSKYIRNFAANYFCGGDAFQLFDVPAGVNAFTVLSFADGVTTPSFKLGPIGAVERDRPSAIAEAVNDDEEGTWINALGSGTLSVEFYDGSNALIGTEQIPVSGVTQKKLATKGTGRLVISLVTCHCGGGGYVDGTPIYGFVTVGTPLGGNLRPYPFGQ